MYDDCKNDVGDGEKSEAANNIIPKRALRERIRNCLKVSVV